MAGGSYLLLYAVGTDLAVAGWFEQLRVLTAGQTHQRRVVLSPACRSAEAQITDVRYGSDSALIDDFGEQARSPHAEHAVIEHAIDARLEHRLLGKAIFEVGHQKVGYGPVGQ